MKCALHEKYERHTVTVSDYIATKLLQQLPGEGVKSNKLIRNTMGWYIVSRTPDTKEFQGAQVK
jgi:hypothetical protein